MMLILPRLHATSGAVTIRAALGELMAADRPLLQLHVEPAQPVEIHELTAALGSLARQYQSFAMQEGLSEDAKEAKLYVSSLQPGSIDILLSPDWEVVITTTAAAGPLLAPLMDKVELLQKFAARIKKLIALFAEKKDSSTVTVSDCNDATNIVNPIAQRGGTQTFNVIHGDVVMPVLVIDAREARQIVENANRNKTAIQSPAAEKRQRVSMIWSRLDREEAKTGKRSPDRGLIEEIDPAPRTILFTDELGYLKAEMIADEENPLQKVYFVDVEVTRTQGRVNSYRIVGYHGKDDL